MGLGGTEESRKLPTLSRWLVIVFCLVGIVFIINQGFSLYIGGVIIETSYLYLIAALLFPPCFLLFPLKKGIRARWAFWLDIFLFALSFGILLNFSFHGHAIVHEGWEAVAPLEQTIMAVIIWFLLLEALRRTGGLILAIVCTLFSLYPLFSIYMPGPLQGQSFPFCYVATVHILSGVSAMGIMMDTFVGILIGFMFFGTTLVATGGSKVFLNLALSLVGDKRGGAAKVSVLSSSLFASISGSSTANIIATGAVTIPAMKKTGYPPHYAGAIEGCASTGGVITPPIMGVAAFIMAMFLGVSYATVVLAAIIPSFLYYIGLLTQVDAFAARNGLKGLPKEELPSFKEVLRKVWPYVLAMAVLLYFLLALRQIFQAPFYASGALLVLTMIRKETRLTFKSFIQYIEDTARLVMWLAGILMGIGLIIGSMSMTGVAFSLAKDITMLAGGNLILLLLAGAIASAILGMGVSLTACYIILVVTIVPSVVASGIPPLAAHLFVLYCGLWSMFTPPVAGAAIVAASLAGSGYIKTAVACCRLGIILFFVPFFFVLDPALILMGEPLQILQALSTAAFGVFILTSALEGYILRIGNLELRGSRILGYLMRLAFIAGGFILALPGWRMDILGLAVVAITLISFLSLRRKGG